MQYYKEIQDIAKVDKSNNILSRIERWEAHKKGILHRALTVTVWYKDQLIFQHRKHPVFDNVFDLTVSSHQLFNSEILEDDLTSVYKTLNRELGLKKDNLQTQPKKMGVIYYKASDKNSAYKEHEMCHIYSCQTNLMPVFNPNFAYGYSLQNKEAVLNDKNKLKLLFAPWVSKMIEENLL